MEDPNFPVTITVGGTGQSYKFSAFPKEMHANQSFILTATIQKADLSAYDLSSATATLYVSGWKNTISPVTLVGGVIVSNTITFTVPKDLIPESLGGLPLRNPGNSVFYFIVEDTDSILQFFQPVNVLDTNYTLSGDVDSSPSVITPDKNDLGTVIQVNLNTPPGSPTFEDAYIVGTSPTGDWVGQNNDLAVYNGSSWVFYDTVEGNFVFDSNTSQQQLFNGTTWGPTAAITYSDGESINDNNGNELIQFGVVGSAVNEVKITNAATGNGPIIAPAGETNIDLNVNATGTGVVKLGSNLDLNGNTLLAGLLGAPLDTNSHQINLSKGADVASAGALTLGTDGNYFDITGTTTITSIATLGIGTQVTLHFDGALTLTHHATDLILPSGANITTAAGDEFTFVEYASGDWRCIGYVLASGEAVVGGGASGILPTAESSKTADYTILSGDVGTRLELGSGTAADKTFTLDVSLFSDSTEQISFINKSSYKLLIEVSNTGTMTINDNRTDLPLWKGDGVLTINGDTSTNANTVAGY